MTEKEWGKENRRKKRKKSSGHPGENSKTKSVTKKQNFGQRERDGGRERETREKGRKEREGGREGQQGW